MKLNLFYFYPLVELLAYMGFIYHFGIPISIFYGFLSFILGLHLLKKNNTLQFPNQMTHVDWMMIKRMNLFQLAGFLLIMPGFVTDTIGFCLWIYGIFSSLTGQKRHRTRADKSGKHAKPEEVGQVIEGEYEVVKDK